MTPQGDLVSAETYNKLFTIHGIIMVWFFLIPSIPAVLGNFLVPLMIGARDLAFPRLNLLVGTFHARRRVHAVCRSSSGGVDTGWTFYTPYSSTYSQTPTSSLTGVGIFIAGFSSILTGLNFIVTIHKMRAPGMTWFRLPLFIWSHLCHQHHHGAGHAGAGDHACADGAGTRVAASASSIRTWAAIRCFFSICSGSIRIRPSTS